MVSTSPLVHGFPHPSDDIWNVIRDVDAERASSWAKLEYWWVEKIRVT